MLGLDMYGSESEDEQGPHGDSPLPLGVGGGLGGIGGGDSGSEHADEDAADEVEKEPSVPRVPHSVQVREALEFTKYQHPMLCPVVEESVPIAPAQAEALEALRQGDKHPTRFIMNHHDFMNPERTNSKLADLAKESAAGSAFAPHRSHLKKLNHLLGEMEKHQDLPKKVMDALHRERRRRAAAAAAGEPHGAAGAKSATPPPSTGAAAGAPPAKRAKMG